MLQAYELVPEAYRKKIGNCLFDKWCQSCNMKTVEEMRELILLEEFKKCLPDWIFVYLNEQKVSSVTNAATLADEFILTHKNAFSMPTPHVLKLERWNQSKSLGIKPPHQQRVRAASVLLSWARSSHCGLSRSQKEKTSPIKIVDKDFELFISQGFISLGDNATPMPVTILRNTAAKQSCILSNILPFSSQS